MIYGEFFYSLCIVLFRMVRLFQSRALVQQFTLKKEYRVRGRTLGGKLTGSGQKQGGVALAS